MRRRGLPTARPSGAAPPSGGASGGRVGGSWLPSHEPATAAATRRYHPRAPVGLRIRSESYGSSEHSNLSYNIATLRGTQQGMSTRAVAACNAARSASFDPTKVALAESATGFWSPGLPRCASVAGAPTPYTPPSIASSSRATLRRSSRSSSSLRLQSLMYQRSITTCTSAVVSMSRTCRSSGDSSRLSASASYFSRAFRDSASASKCTCSPA